MNTRIKEKKHEQQSMACSMMKLLSRPAKIPCLDRKSLNMLSERNPLG
jgi:hypothetical protein